MNYFLLIFAFAFRMLISSGVISSTKNSNPMVRCGSTECSSTLNSTPASKPTLRSIADRNATPARPTTCSTSRNPSVALNPCERKLIPVFAKSPYSQLLKKFRQTLLIRSSSSIITASTRPFNFAAWQRAGGRLAPHSPGGRHVHHTPDHPSSPYKNPSTIRSTIPIRHSTTNSTPATQKTPNISAKSDRSSPHNFSPTSGPHPPTLIDPPRLYPVSARRRQTVLKDVFKNEAACLAGGI